MKGIVWGHTFQTAKEQLMKIQENYERYRIPVTRIKNSPYEYWIEFSNGDVWRAASARESARGNKVNVSYIDRKIDPLFIDVIIRPCTVAFPYQAFRYYGEPNYWVEEENEVAENLN